MNVAKTYLMPLVGTVRARFSTSSCAVGSRYIARQQQDFAINCKNTFDSSIRAVIVGATNRALDKTIRVNGSEFSIVNHPTLKLKNVGLIAIGKAATTAAKHLKEQLGDQLTQGIVLPKSGQISESEVEQFRLWGMSVQEGDHPYPGEKSIAANSALVNYCSENGKQSQIIVVSGGGTAICARPINEVLEEMPNFDGTLSKRDIKQFRIALKAFTTAGLHISKKNILTQTFARLGGRLRPYLYNPNSASPHFIFNLSDIARNPDDPSFSSLDAEPASRPFSVPNFTVDDVIEIVNQHPILKQSLPLSYKCYLDHLKSGDASLSYENADKNLDIRSQTVYSNEMMVHDLEQDLISRGWEVDVNLDGLCGEAEPVGMTLADSVLEKYNRLKEGQKLAILVGSEPVTTITADTDGEGGPYQVAAIHCSMRLSKIMPQGSLWFGGIVSSDGESGVGKIPVAGGYVSPFMTAAAEALQISPNYYLSRYDSNNFLRRVDLDIKLPVGENYTGCGIIFLQK